jgi:hypothetical protein
VTVWVAAIPQTPLTDADLNKLTDSDGNVLTVDAAPTEWESVSSVATVWS